MAETAPGAVTEYDLFTLERPGQLALARLGRDCCSSQVFFQFSRLKHTCLARCRSPLGFLVTEWRDGPWGAFKMGLKHGGYCLGCCWALMGLLFAFGVMNLLWVAGLSAFVLLEKITPASRWLSRLSGLLSIGWATWIVFGS